MSHDDGIRGSSRMSEHCRNAGFKPYFTIFPIVLLLSSFTLFGCGSAANNPDRPKELQENINPNILNKVEDIKSENRYPFLEIRQERDGSVAIPGTSLYFRMYDDRALEFDYVLKKPDPSGYPRSLYSLERTPPTKISEAEFGKFEALVDELIKSKDVKSEYKPVALTLDVETKLTLVLNQNGVTVKKIVINDADYDVISSKYERLYPSSLVTLIKEIRLLRNEYD